ncbi:MAG: hypothetical protein AAFV86_05815 [Pseudomonadota bacterium]
MSAHGNAPPPAGHAAGGGTHGAPTPRTSPPATAAAAPLDTDRRRARDAARALPLAGLLLLASPLTQAFAIEGRVLGVPVIAAMVFGAWALLILAAWLVARRMLEREQARPAPRPGVIHPPVQAPGRGAGTPPGGHG